MEHSNYNNNESRIALTTNSNFQRNSFLVHLSNRILSSRELSFIYFFSRLHIVFESDAYLIKMEPYLYSIKVFARGNPDDDVVQDLLTVRVVLVKAGRFADFS